jgi:hypothetical protein
MQRPVSGIVGGTLFLVYSRPAFLYYFRGYYFQGEHDQCRHKKKVVDLTEDWDEIRDDVNRGKGIGDRQPKESLGRPGGFFMSQRTLIYFDFMSYAFSESPEFLEHSVSLR